MRLSFSLLTEDGCFRSEFHGSMEIHVTKRKAIAIPFKLLFVWCHYVVEGKSEGQNLVNKPLGNVGRSSSCNTPCAYHPRVLSHTVPCRTIRFVTLALGLHGAFSFTPTGLMPGP